MMLRAEGQAQALDRVFQVARTLESNTMTLQYLDTLRILASAPSTKLLIPAELTNLLEPIRQHAGSASASGAGDGAGRR